MANTQVMHKDLVFNKAGHFKLQKFNERGQLDPNAVYHSLNQIVKSVKRATTTTSSSLEDGNSQYSAHEYITGEETILTFGLSTYDPELEAFVKNADYDPESAEAKEFYFAQVATIDESLKVVLENPVADENAEIIVRDKFGNTYKKSDDAAAEGTYTVALAETDEKIPTLTFSAADKDKEIGIVYAGSVTGVTSISYKETPKNVAMQVTVISASLAYQEEQEQYYNVIVDKATLNGGLTPPDLSKDPTGGWELAFKTGKPRAGKKPVEIKLLKK